MHFAPTEEQAMIGETARDFFARHATSERTRVAMAAGGFDGTLWTAFARDLGLTGILVPEQQGGAGLGLVELALVAEAAGATVAALPLLGQVMAIRALVAGGDSAQRARWLPRLADGSAIAAVACDDRIAVDGDRLTGSLPLVPHGAVADLLVVVSGEAAFLVAADDAGVSREAVASLDETRPFATVRLHRAPAERLAAGAAGAARAAGLLCLAAEAAGGARETLDRTVAYAKERVQFGRAIGSFQAVKHRLADMMVEIEQARSAVWWAACAVDEGAADASLALHAAKSFAADTFASCAGHMIQLHGGIGFTWEHDAHLFFKRARSIQTLLGTGDAHREAIARIVLDEAA